MEKIVPYRKALCFYTLIATLSAGALMMPAQARAIQGGGLAANSASMPLIVQMRGNTSLAPALLTSMSRKAGTPLQITRRFGAGTYLVRPARAATAQGLRSIAAKLATHPNVLDAHLYQQSAPAYMIAPAGQPVVLNGARLSGTTSPVTSYRWHQITGSNTGLPNSSRPDLTFMARQSASPGTAVSDPAAINPGDLSALPQTFDCAISAASLRKSALTAPMLVSKNAFMCNPNGSSASPPAAGSPPASSGNPTAGTPSDSATPSAGLPPVDTANPSSGVPPGSSSFPGSGNPGSPQDTFAPPAGANNPSPGAGTPLGGSPGGSGLQTCDGECSKALLVPGGQCSGDCYGAKFNGTANPGGSCSGDCYGATGGHCDGECSNISANSIRVGSTRRVANIIGYRLIATDKVGIAHVRNIYVQVQPNTTSQARPAKSVAPAQKMLPARTTGSPLKQFRLSTTGR